MNPEQQSPYWEEFETLVRNGRKSVNGYYYFTFGRDKDIKYKLTARLVDGIFVKLFIEER